MTNKRDKGQQELGVAGQITVDLVGDAASNYVKVHGGGALSAALTGSASRIATTKLLKALKRAAPDDTIEVIVVGTAKVFVVPVVFLLGLFCSDPDDPNYVRDLDAPGFTTPGSHIF